MSTDHAKNKITRNRGRVASIVLGGAAILALSACGEPARADRTEPQPEVVSPDSVGSDSTVGGDAWSNYYSSAGVLSVARVDAPSAPTVGSDWWNLYYEHVGSM